VSEWLINGRPCASERDTERVSNSLPHRIHLRVLLALTALALIYLSFYPFNFQWNPHPTMLRWHSPSIDSDWVDMLANFIGYLPLGFLAMAAWDLKSAKGVALVILSGILFSTGIELAQMYLPVRDSNILDLTFNTLGTAAGAFAARKARESLTSLNIPWPPLKGIVLALLWTGWQMYPFFPILRRPSLQRLAVQLPRWDFQRNEFGDIVLAAILLYAFLQRSDEEGGFTAALVTALLALTLFAQFLVFGMSYSNARIAAATVGWVAASLLWRPDRAHWISLSLVVLGWIVFREMQPFSWIPTSPWGSMDNNLYIRALGGKAFFFLSAVMSLRRTGFTVKENHEFEVA
jgi:glycopeptide antibiotics resistance protein